MSGVKIRVTSDSSRARQDLRKLKGSVNNIEKSVDKVGRAFRNMAIAVGAAFAASQLTKGISRSSDAIADLGNRVALVTGRGKAAEQTLKRLFKISADARVPVAVTADTFNRFGLALKDANKPMKELLRVTETVQKTATISGASADTAAASIMQLGQGLASGQLRGEELNSVLEGIPRLAQAVADGMGIPFGKLRQAAMDGLLTTDAVFNAILKESNKVQDEFLTIEATISSLTNVMKDEFTRAVSEIARLTKASDALKTVVINLTKFFRFLADNLDKTFARINLELVLFKNSIAFNLFLAKKSIIEFFDFSPAGMALVRSFRRTEKVLTNFKRVVSDSKDSIIESLKKMYSEMDLSVIDNPTLVYDKIQVKIKEFDWVIPKMLKIKDKILEKLPKIELETYSIAIKEVNLDNVFKGKDAVIKTLFDWAKRVKAIFYNLWYFIVGGSYYTGIYNAGDEEQGRAAIGNTSALSKAIDPVVGVFSSWAESIKEVFRKLHEEITRLWGEISTTASEFSRDDLFSMADSGDNKLKAFWADASAELDNYNSRLREFIEINTAEGTTYANTKDNLVNFWNRATAAVQGYVEALRASQGAQDTKDLVKTTFDIQFRVIAGTFNELRSMGEEAFRNIKDGFDANQDKIAASVVGTAILVKLKYVVPAFKLVGLYAALRTPFFQDQIESIGAGLGGFIAGAIFGESNEKGFMRVAGKGIKNFAQGIFRGFKEELQKLFGGGIDVLDSTRLKDIKSDTTGDGGGILGNNIAQSIVAGIGTALTLAAVAKLILPKWLVSPAIKTIGGIGKSLGTAIAASTGAKFNTEFKDWLKRNGKKVVFRLAVGVSFVLGAETASNALEDAFSKDGKSPLESMLLGGVEGAGVGAAIGILFGPMGALGGAIVGGIMGSIIAGLKNNREEIMNYFFDIAAGFGDSITRAIKGDKFLVDVISKYESGDLSSTQLMSMINSDSIIGLETATDAQVKVISDALNKALGEKPGGGWLGGILSTRDDSLIQALEKLEKTIADARDLNERYSAAKYSPSIDDPFFQSVSTRAYQERAFRGYSTGGLINGPGSGTSDDIPTMLSNGEYVIRESSVRKFGPQFLAAINRGEVPQFRNNGGLMGAYDTVMSHSFTQRLGGNLSGLVEAFKSMDFGRILGTTSGYTDAFRQSGYLAAALMRGGSGDLTDGYLTYLFRDDTGMGRLKNLFTGNADSKVYKALSGMATDFMETMILAMGMNTIPGVGSVLSLLPMADGFILRPLQGLSRGLRDTGAYSGITSGISSALKFMEDGHTTADLKDVLFRGPKSIFAGLMSYIPGFSTGGRVHGPGSSTSDDIPAMLSRDEFVMQASAVKKFGPAFMAAINSGIVPQGFNRGTDSIRAFDNIYANATPVQSRVLQSAENMLLMDNISGLEQLLMANRWLAKSLSGLTDLTDDHSAAVKKAIKNSEDATAAEQKKAFAAGFLSDFKSALSELFKTGDFGQFFRSLLDRATSRIIDAGVNAFADSLFDSSGLNTMFENLFSGITGGSNGKGGASGLGNWLGSLFGGGMKIPPIMPLGGLGSFLAFSQGGVVPSTPYSQAGVDSVPAMLMPGEMVIPKSQVGNFGGGNQTVVNLSITGDISKQTKKEVIKMLPTIASGVNATNRENNYRR